MAKAKARRPSFNIKELDLKDAQREFARKRSRGSKYDDVVNAAEKLAKGKALLVEGLTASEVTGLRKRMTDILGEDWTVGSTKVDAKEHLYDVLIHREK